MPQLCGAQSVPAKLIRRVLFVGLSIRGVRHIFVHHLPALPSDVPDLHQRDISRVRHLPVLTVSGEQSVPLRVQSWHVPVDNQQIVLVL